MLQLVLWALKDRFQAMADEKGAVAFEYLLVVAGVSVAMIAAIALAAPNLIAQTVYGTCLALKTVMTGMVCTAPV